MSKKHATAYYRGFGIPGAPGILGKVWGPVEISWSDGMRWVFQYEREGYNSFRGYYPSGRVCEEGKCLVEVMGFQDQPFPDQHNVRNSRCYLPDGTLGSEVKDGTGTQTYWTPEGVKIWELVLENYVRRKHTMWSPSGQLIATQDYAEGEVHGPFESYHPNGSLKTVGAYSYGKRSGTWKRYKEDGTLESVEVYEDGKLISEEKERSNHGGNSYIE